jgi:hypothetical protein
MIVEMVTMIATVITAVAAVPAAWVLIRDRIAAQEARIVLQPWGASRRAGGRTFRIRFLDVRPWEVVEATVTVANGPARLQLLDRYENSPDPETAKLSEAAPPASRTLRVPLARWINEPQDEHSGRFDIIEPEGSASILKVAVTTSPSRARLSTRKVAIKSAS